MKLLTIISVTLLFLPACAFSRPVPPATSPIAIESTGNNAVRIIQTSTQQKDGNLIIKGAVERRSRNVKKWFPAGHIDATLVSPSGKIIRQVTTDYIPRIIPRKTNGRKSFFTLQLPVPPHEEGTLRLSFHSGIH